MTYRQNIGAILMRFSRTVEGKLCARCADRHFWETSAITLFLGWWGIVSFFVTPFVLLANLAQHLGTRSLDAATASPGASRGLRRGLAGGAALLAIAALAMASLGARGALVALVAVLLSAVAFVMALRRPLVAGAAVSSLLALGFSVLFLGVALVVGLRQAGARQEAARSAVPGYAAFQSANATITAYDAEVAFGNTSRSRELARRFSELLGSMEKIAFTGGAEEGAISLTRGHFLTYAELRRDRLAFLVHVPQLRAYEGEARQGLLKLAWMAAQQVSSELRRDRDLELAVALRGVALYGGLAIGKGGAEEPQHSDVSTAVDTERLYAFFTGPAFDGDAAGAPTEGEAGSPDAATAPPPPPQAAAPPDLSQIVRDIQSDDAGVALRARGQLYGLGAAAAPAEPEFLRLARDLGASIDARCAALHSLGRIGDRRAQELIFATVADERVGHCAGEAIPYLAAGSEEVATRLATELRRRCVDVPPEAGDRSRYCFNALGAVGREGTSGEVPASAVVAVLQSCAGEPERCSFVWQAMGAAGRLGPAARDGASALITIVEKSSRSDIRREAIIALGLIGPDARAAAPLLHRLSTSDPEIPRQVIAEALDRIESR